VAKIKSVLASNRGRVSVMLLGSTILLVIMAIGMKFWIFGVAAIGSFIIYACIDPKCGRSLLEEDIVERYKKQLPGKIEEEE